MNEPTTGKSRGALTVLFLILVMFVAGHAVFLSARYTNIECWAGKAARLAFEGHWLDAIRTSQRAISSPPLTFFIILPSYALFGVNEAAARLPTLLAAVAVIMLVFETGRRWYAPAVGALAAALIAFNPLFWVYTSQICCNDLPFTLTTTLTLLALVAALRSDSPLAHVVAGMCVGGSLLVKYNAAAFVPVIAVIIIVSRIRSDGRPSALYFLRTSALYLPGTALAAMILLGVRTVSGSLINTEIAPSNVGSVPSFGILMPPRLASYVMWLGLLLGPLCILAARDLRDFLGTRRLLRGMLVAAPINALLLALFNLALRTAPQNLGEMRLGWTEHLLGAPALWSIQFVGLTVGEVVLGGLLLWGYRRPWPSGIIALWTVGLLFVDGFWRGATRYLIYLLPGHVVYIADAALRRGSSPAFARVRVMVIAYAMATGLVLGIFSTAYFAAEGRAAADVAHYINEHQLAGLEYGISNVVLTHCEYLIDDRLFARPGTTPLYITVTWPRGQLPEGALYQRPVKLLGVVWKTYGVVPWTPSLSDPLGPSSNCCPFDGQSVSPPDH